MRKYVILRRGKPVTPPLPALIEVKPTLDDSWFATATPHAGGAFAGPIAKVNALIDDGTIDRFNDAAVAGGSDGLGDPMTSKGLQQVVYATGEFAIMSYGDACLSARMDPDYVAMIEVSALRAALRQALN